MTLASFYKMMGRNEILATGANLSRAMAATRTASSAARAGHNVLAEVAHTRAQGYFAHARKAAGNWFTAPGRGWGTRAARWGALGGTGALGYYGVTHRLSGPMPIMLPM